MEINLTSSIEALKKRDADIKSYVSIMGQVRRCDVSADAGFQRQFNRFYRVRRGADWRAAYYGLFERCKGADGLTFEEILRTVYDETGMIEASYSSKLLASLCPDVPILDSVVLARLGLRITGTTKQEKLESAIMVYDAISCWYRYFQMTEQSKEFVQCFDDAFPEYVGISAVKKIDFLLWAYRV